MGRPLCKQLVEIKKTMINAADRGLETLRKSTIAGDYFCDSKPYTATFGYIYALRNDIANVTIIRITMSKGSCDMSPVTSRARRPSTM